MIEEHILIAKLPEALQEMGAIRDNSVYALNTIWREVWPTVKPDKDGHLREAPALAQKLIDLGLKGTEGEVAGAIGMLAQAICAGKHPSMKLWVQATGGRRHDWWNNFAWSLPPEALED